MPATRRMVIAGLLALVAGLLILFPARAAYHWFGMPEIALSGLDGSIWNGKARDASVSGVYLQNLTWRLRPHRLLTGKLTYAIEASPTGGFLDGEIGVSPGGSLDVRNLRASIPVAALEQATGFGGIRGVVNAEIARLRLDDGAPVFADGKIEVAALMLPLVSPTPLGGFIADFSTQADGVVASIEDTDAVVDVAGSLLIGKDRSYEFLGQIAPKPETPRAIRQALPRLGSANARGQHELRLEGSL